MPIENITIEDIGTFKNVAYIRVKGKFTGNTSLGDFAVPCEISTPKNSAEGNRTFVLEPPHFTSGLVARDVTLGQAFLFKSGFSHASVGYSNLNLRILDKEVKFTLRIGGHDVIVLPPGAPGAITDYEILREFALELKQNPLRPVGQVERIYSIGFSDSGATVRDIYDPFGHKLFDISFPGTASYLAPVRRAGAKPIMVFNTESDFSVETVVDPAFPNYRWYAVPGAPHIPDNRLTRATFNEDKSLIPGPGPAPSRIAGTTPIDWSPFFRALFVAGDEWVRNGTQPPASTVLKVIPGGFFEIDVIGNAKGGIRHPALEAKEATFIASVVRGRRWDNFGAYHKLRPFNNFTKYTDIFRSATENLVKARYLLKASRDVLNQMAGLHQGDTYTINYYQDRFYRTPSPTSEDDFTP